MRTLKERGFATNASLDAQVAAFGSARAAAAQAKAAIADRVIRAPFSGGVSLRNVSAGAVIPAGTEIATLSDLSQSKLDFSIPEPQIATVQDGQVIEHRVTAFPDHPVRGTVKTIFPGV